MRLLRYGLLTCLLLVGSALQAAEPRITADVVYGHKDGMALVYDVFQPAVEPNGAAVVYMISGGWFSRWTAPENRVAGFRYLLDEGYTVIAVHHGSAPRFTVPEAYADVRRALRHIHMRADDFAIDPARIGVTGSSAGGHLSLMLGLNADAGDPEADDVVLRHGNAVAAVVAYFPPVDLRRMTGPNERFPALDFDNALAAGISPLLLAEPGDPPVLLIHGDADTLVDISHSENMFAALQAADVTSEFIVIEGAGHGFTGADARRATQARLEWFNRYLLP